MKHSLFIISLYIMRDKKVEDVLFCTKKIKSTIDVALCAMTFVVGSQNISIANEIITDSQDVTESGARYTYIRTAQSNLSISGGNTTVIAIADVSPVVTKCFIT